MDELSENLSAISFSFAISRVSSSSEDLVQASGRCSDAAALSEVQEREREGGELNPCVCHFMVTQIGRKTASNIQPDKVTLSVQGLKKIIQYNLERILHWVGL